MNLDPKKKLEKYVVEERYALTSDRSDYAFKRF